MSGRAAKHGKAVVPAPVCLQFCEVFSSLAFLTWQGCGGFGDKFPLAASRRYYNIPQDALELHRLFPAREREEERQRKTRTEMGEAGRRHRAASPALGERASL